MTTYNKTGIDIFEDAGWDENQMVDVTIVQRVMGTISFIGSMYVIQEVLRNEKKRNHTFHRLMVGLSISDVFSSVFVHILSTAPMPKGYQVLAVGNVATCDAQGFINTTCFFTTLTYNCSLATYYLIQLKYNWINRRIKALEKRLHIVPWSVGLLMGILGLVFKMNGPSGFICRAMPGYPIECTDPDLSVECIRGGNPSVTWLFFVAFLSSTSLGIGYVFVTMYIVYRSISNIEIQAHEYSFARYTSQKSDRKRSRRVLLQGILYSSALFLVYIFTVVAYFNSTSYVFRILQFTFWPLQGSFNALIYSMPVFQKMYKKLREKRRERQTATLLKLEDEKVKCSESLNILTELSKNEKKEEAVSLNAVNFKTSKLLSMNSSIEDDSKSVVDKNQLNQSVLTIDKNVEEDVRNREFDRKKGKEEIKKISETSIIHSKLAISDNQFQLKRNDQPNICHHGNDVCDGEEIEGETQGKSEYVFIEENIEGGNNHDADKSDYSDDDIDDYLVLSSRRL